MVRVLPVPGGPCIMGTGGELTGAAGKAGASEPASSARWAGMASQCGCCRVQAGVRRGLRRHSSARVTIGG